MIHIRTYNGVDIDLASPFPWDFLIPDIARGLSNACRFAGQVRHFYSVAEHSRLVAALVPPHLYRAALFHDASEAYLGDLSRNLKHDPRLAGYRDIEDLVTHAIHTRFDIRPLSKQDALVLKAADDLAAIFEHVHLRTGEPWFGYPNVAQRVHDGFVRTPVALIEPMISRLPLLGLACHPPARIYDLFVDDLRRVEHV